MISRPASLSRVAAIVGVGETDYAADYAIARGPHDRVVTRHGAPDKTPDDTEVLMIRAFERALADCGLARNDVDGLIYSLDQNREISGDPASVFGIEARLVAKGDSVTPMGGNRGAIGTVARAVQAVAHGDCNVLALVYAAVSRTTGKQFGGNTYLGDGRSSYYFYHPWGWSSQAAHWALMFREYSERFGASEEDLGRVAIALRDHAALNENAIMRTPLTMDDYRAAPYIVQPLRRLDLCLPNDGAVCLILRRAEDSGGARHVPVLIAGWGNAEIEHQKMKYMVRELLRVQLHAAGEQAFAMAGLTRGDVNHFEGYDASTFHLANQIEGYGLVPAGSVFECWRQGQLSLGGSLPVNTSGGMLSEAYMHGWNHLVEATRQLRHEAGRRQIPGTCVSMFSLATTESAHPILLERGES
ncbi:MAG: thiolase family protein [Frankia sp.]